MAVGKDPQFSHSQGKSSNKTQSRSKKSDSTDGDKSLFAEKLAVIDEEIRALHEFCKNKGFSQSVITQSASPLLDAVKHDERRQYVKIAGKICLVFGLICLAFTFDPTYRRLCMYGRRASILVSVIIIIKNDKFMCIPILGVDLPYHDMVDLELHDGRNSGQRQSRVLDLKVVVVDFII